MSQLADSIDYLNQLVDDKNQLVAFPDMFTHLGRLLDEGKLEYPTTNYLD